MGQTRCSTAGRAACCSTPPASRRTRREEGRPPGSARGRRRCQGGRRAKGRRRRGRCTRSTRCVRETSKEVHTTVCRQRPSAFLCGKKGSWTYERESSCPSIRRISLCVCVCSCMTVLVKHGSFTCETKRRAREQQGCVGSPRHVLENHLSQ